MLTFILKRLLEAIPTLFVVATLTFFMMHAAPGGPFDDERVVSPEVEASLASFYGLDQSVGAQYVQYLKNLLQGDLGPSLKYVGVNVKDIILEKLPVTLELALYSFILALILGVLLGSLAAIQTNTWTDRVVMSFSALGICLPHFVLGPLLLVFFGLHLEWFNVSGWNSWSDRILPAVTLACYYLAYISRLTRSNMLDTLNQDYVRTAYAKGLPEWRVLSFHGLRNAIQPVISYSGPAFAGLLTGSFAVETIFHIPGLGRFFILSAFNRDYTMVLGTVLFYATALIILNLIADAVMVWLNPVQKST